MKLPSIFCENNQSNREETPGEEPLSDKEKLEFERKQNHIRNKIGMLQNQRLVAAQFYRGSIALSSVLVGGVLTAVLFRRQQIWGAIDAITSGLTTFAGETVFYSSISILTNLYIFLLIFTGWSLWISISVFSRKKMGKTISDVRNVEELIDENEKRFNSLHNLARYFLLSTSFSILLITLLYSLQSWTPVEPGYVATPILISAIFVPPIGIGTWTAQLITGILFRNE